MTTTIAPRLHPNVARSDWWPLVRASVVSVAIVLGAKVAGTLLIGNLMGAPVRFATWNGLPYLRVETAPAQFADLVSWSSLVMAGAVCVLAVTAYFRPHPIRDVIDGRMLGIIVAIETVGLEVARHVVSGPVVSLTLTSVTLGSLALAVAVLLTLRPRSHPWWELGLEAAILEAPTDDPDLAFDFDGAVPSEPSVALFDDAGNPTRAVEHPPIT